MIGFRTQFSTSICFKGIYWCTVSIEVEYWSGECEVVQSVDIVSRGGKKCHILKLLGSMCSLT